MNKINTTPFASSMHVEGADEELPTVSSTDNGKILSVANGKWGANTPVKELPAVTASDNGNVLTVVEGQWAKAAAPSGGGSILRITLTEDSESPGTFHADKTYSEINEFALSTEGQGLIIAMAYETANGAVGQFLVDYEIDEAEYDGEEDKIAIYGGTQVYPTISSQTGVSVYLYYWLYDETNDVWSHYTGTFDVSFTG